MTTYTAFNSSTGEVIGRGLTSGEAAAERLTCAGGKFEIVQGDDRTEIVGRDSRGGIVTLWDGPTAHGHILFELGGAPAERLERLHQRILLADWSNVPIEVMSDADYDADQAEIAAAG